MSFERFIDSELDIIAKNNPDSFLLKFREEFKILASKYSELGTSGASNSYFARGLSKAVANIFEFEPLSPIRLDISEFANVGYGLYQHKRKSDLFFYESSGEFKYGSAVLFQREPSGSYFHGGITTQSFKGGVVHNSLTVNPKFDKEYKTFIAKTIELSDGTTVLSESGAYEYEKARRYYQ